jgi:hypothetical protein
MRCFAVYTTRKTGAPGWLTHRPSVRASQSREQLKGPCGAPQARGRAEGRARGVQSCAQAPPVRASKRFRHGSWRTGGRCSAATF